MTPVALTFNGAVVATRGGPVLVIAVRPWILEDTYEAELIQLAFELRFRCPVVLMAQDGHGAPRFVGSRTVVRLVRALPFDQIRWVRYTITNGRAN